jgi:hypothetical protein
VKNVRGYLGDIDGKLTRPDTGAGRGERTYASARAEGLQLRMV